MTTSTSKTSTDKPSPSQDVSTSVDLPPDAFVPASTRDNYLEIVRGAARTNGTSAKTELGNLVAQFRRDHKTDPTSGWDHLANALEGVDPDEGAPVSAATLARARAIESARRDPSTAMAGAQEVIDAAHETWDQRATETAPGADMGTVPNPGPLPVTAPSSADVAAEKKAD